MIEVLINPNELIGKKFDYEKYHCYHFIEEVFGKNVPQLLDVSTATKENDFKRYEKYFKTIKEPFDNCIAVLGSKHIGVYFQNGIYHNDAVGVRYEPILNIKMKYKDITYYDIC